MSEPTTFTCPECGRVSHHRDDARFGYCENCHDYTGSDGSIDDVTLSAMHTAAAFISYGEAVDEVVAQITPERTEAALQRILRRAQEP